MSIAEFTEPIGLNKQLNPKLWAGAHLRIEVQVALLRIAKAYYKFLDIDVPIVDIVITGSQVNYNYTEYSDLDLHLIVPYESVNCDLAAAELFDAKRRLWKQNHDLYIHSVPVELYAEDSKTPAVSSVYSVLKSSWRKKPGTPIIDYDRKEVRRLFDVWESLILKAIQTGDLEFLEKIKDMLKTFREAALSKDGEFGAGNLAFKALRNDGLVGKLMNAIANATDKNLSI
jgi:hypothetical protein